MTAPVLTSWQAVADEVLARIRRRDWAPGDLIPNEVDLAGEMGCARTTVNRALRHLAARDLDTRSLRWQYFLDAIWQQPAVYRCHYAISPLVRAACQQASRQ